MFVKIVMYSQWADETYTIYNRIDMSFTYQDQLQYVKLALALFESERPNVESLETILGFGELINKYSGVNNALIYDAIEYIYEQLRLICGEDGAYDDVELRKQLEDYIGSA